MKKFFCAVLCISLLVACDKVESVVSADQFVGEYDGVMTMTMSLSALPDVTLPPMSDSISFSIEKIDDTHIRLVYTDSTYVDATINGNELAFETEPVDFSYESIAIDGLSSGTGTLNNGTLTINHSFNGTITGFFEYMGYSVPLSGVCTGVGTTVAIKK